MLSSTSLWQLRTLVLLCLAGSTMGTRLLDNFLKNTAMPIYVLAGGWRPSWKMFLPDPNGMRASQCVHLSLGKMTAWYSTQWMKPSRITGGTWLAISRSGRTGVSIERTLILRSGSWHLRGLRLLAVHCAATYRRILAG